jgi:hypothetical protein
VYNSEIIGFAKEAALGGDPAAITMLAQATLAKGHRDMAVALVAPIADAYLPARRLHIQLREEAGEDVQSELAALRDAYQQAADSGDIPPTPRLPSCITVRICRFIIQRRP